MTLLQQLQENKGTVSSALGKQLAIDVLHGNKNLLSEALKLIHFDDKNVRSGSAKIIEKVAESKPELIAPHLSELIECMNYEEAQTRWMVLHIAGLCAKFQPKISRDLFHEAVNYLDKKHGTVLNDRAITYFGYMGAVSNKDCNNSFPHLINSFSRHPNRATRIFESFERMLNKLNEEQKETLLKITNKYKTDKKPSNVSWAKKLLKKLCA